MKVLVVCLLVTAALADAAPSDVLPGDVPALTPSAGTSSSPSLVSTPAEKTSADSGVLPADVSAITPNAGTSSSSSSLPLVPAPLEKISADADAALPAEKVEPAAGAALTVTPIDVDKVKAERQDKGDASVEPVVEAAEPSMFSGLDVPLNPPVKKVPVYVPVEYSGAYHPESFFKPSPVRSGGYIAAPAAAAYPHRSVANPLYQLVSPDVPILTLYPEPVEDFSRADCADPSLKYVYGGGGGPMVYGGPAAASPYAANHYAAASLANMGHGGNPNPYGNHAPYYRLSHIPFAAAPSVDYSRSDLISPTSELSPISSHIPLSRISSMFPSSSVYFYPGSSKFNPQLAPMMFYTSSGLRREYAAEPDRLVNV